MNKRNLIKTLFAGLVALVLPKKSQANEIEQYYENIKNNLDLNDYLPKLLKRIEMNQLVEELLPLPKKICEICGLHCKYNDSPNPYVYIRKEGDPIFELVVCPYWNHTTGKTGFYDCDFYNKYHIAIDKEELKVGLRQFLKENYVLRSANGEIISSDLLMWEIHDRKKHKPLLEEFEDPFYPKDKGEISLDRMTNIVKNPFYNNKGKSFKSCSDEMIGDFNE